MGTCGCGGDNLYLLFPCSGAADTGEITDQAARSMSRCGLGRMSCLALVGSDNQPLLDAARRATGLLAIDGCPEDCARKTLESHGLTNVLHLRLSDIGLAKGKSPATKENIEKVVCAALPMMPAGCGPNTAFA